MTAASAPEVRGGTVGLGSPEWGGFDRRRARRDRPSDLWRAFRTSAGLGWQMEANWTDPFLFFIYSVAKPLSAALILVVMLDIISGGADPAYRAFVVIGTSLWAVVMAGISGPAWTILDDRERYRMLKYVYVSPSEFLAVLLGRGVARLGVGVMGGLITITVGVLLLLFVAYQLWGTSIRTAQAQQGLEDDFAARLEAAEAAGAIVSGPGASTTTRCAMNGPSTLGRSSIERIGYIDITPMPPAGRSVGGENR